ncbi:MAG: CopD family protein [Pseudomonadota bacterium]|uniref:CopD family protein n=1 Tax=Gallaecimonas pentaromativorans TaxID=584787 RepID=UPI00067F2341|nr:CopD family protein [Gallaecimonas pentaromativorans]MED5526992.1 CopD family protein [Pseudomonadota bacterium]
MWPALIVASKWGIYLTLCSAIGALFIQVMALFRLPGREAIHRHLGRYGLFCGVGGALMALGHFLSLVGSFSGKGLSGITDTTALALLWLSPEGAALCWRLAAAALVVMVALGLRLGFYRQLAGKALLPISYALAAIFMAIGGTRNGHSLDMGGVGQVLIALHLLAVGWWLGALYPLWYLSRTLGGREAAPIMARFGEDAAVVLVVLFITGCSALILIGVLPELGVSPYGKMMAIKLLLVIGVLLLAARHKWKLVPTLAASPDASALARSIVIEGLVMLSLLAATAYLSLLPGPG